MAYVNGVRYIISTAQYVSSYLWPSTSIMKACERCTESHLNIAYPPNYVYLYTVLLYGSFLIFYI